MTYKDKYLGRVRGEASVVGRVLKPGAADTAGFAEVEERLVETVRLWWRSPGGGRSPFAGDGPWHLVSASNSTAARAERYRDAKELGEDVNPRPRPLPLTRDQIAERDAVSEWLSFVPERDRQLVKLVLIERAMGRRTVRWSAIRAELNEEISPKGLDWRYSKAIHSIAVHLGMAENCASACQGELDNR